LERPRELTARATVQAVIVGRTTYLAAAFLVRSTTYLAAVPSDWAASITRILVRAQPLACLAMIAATGTRNPGCRNATHLRAASAFPHRVVGNLANAEAFRIMCVAAASLDERPCCGTRAPGSEAKQTRFRSFDRDLPQADVAQIVATVRASATCVLRRLAWDEGRDDGIDLRRS
jgi:hypothetical protein